MKRVSTFGKVIFAMAFIFFFRKSYGSEWFPIGATWYYGIGGCCGPVREDAARFEVTKDTVINGKLHKIVEGTYTAFGGVEYGFKRNIYLEENDRVYRLKDTSYLPLADFGKQAGDSFIIQMNTVYACDSVKFIIDSIGHLQQLRVQYGKVYSVDSCAQPSPLRTYAILEKVVDPLLIDFNPFYIIDGGYTVFRCYNDDSIHVSLTQCDTILSVKNQRLQEKKCFPNPVSNELHFDLNELNAATHFVIYNAAGKAVKEGTVQHGVIQVAGLPDAYYTGVLYAGKEAFHFRFYKE
jgi:hypothetical protein